MKNAMYRLLNPTLAIQTKDGKTAAVVLPRGVTLIVSKPKAEDNDSMVECIWDRDTVLMLAFDLRERGERVTSATTPAD